MNSHTNKKPRTRIGFTNLASPAAARAATQAPVSEVAAPPTSRTRTTLAADIAETCGRHGAALLADLARNLPKHEAVLRLCARRIKRVARVVSLFASDEEEV